jgi:CheY-like chemotaxis protein
VSAESDGKLALDFLYKTDRLPQLIISDIMMPNMNGIEFLEHLKKCPDFEQIPVFANTSLEKEEIYAETNYHFDRIFQKPFSIQELSEAIEQELQKLTS